MPGILPMRIRSMACGNCVDRRLNCDLKKPSCSNCLFAGIDCTDIKPICAPCHIGRISCDGIRPSCSPCALVRISCKYVPIVSTEELLGASYIKSAEAGVKILDAPIRGHKVGREEIQWSAGDTAQIVSLSKEKTTGNPVNTRDLELVVASKMVDSAINIYTVDIEQDQDFGDGNFKTNQKKTNISISQWVEEKVESAGKADKYPGLSLLVIETPDKPVPKADFKLLPPRQLYDEVAALILPVLETLNLSRLVLDTFGSLVFDKRPIHTASFRTPNKESPLSFTYHIGFGFISLAFRYFPESQTSIGILLVQDYKDIVEQFFRDLITNRHFINNPFLVPLLAHQSLTKIVSAWLTAHEEDIVDAQSQTGFHHMLSLKRIPEVVDYTHLSAKISGTAVNIATNEFCWQMLMSHAEYLAQELTATGSKTDLTTTEYLQSEADRLARHARLMLYEAESWQKKASILVQGIFNLIAQQDQNTSIGIARDSKLLAEESKRDSTSMKAIAIVTMTFLPGTFAAALFSMPMFQWNSISGGDIVSPRFWIYWALTVPLTLCTFLIWAFSIRLRNKEKF